MSSANGRVGGNQRYRSGRVCPICGGSEDDDRGLGTRCYGYIGGDGLYAHCSREERAGAIDQTVNSQTYAHLLKGPCKCGHEHSPSDPRPTSARKTTKAGRIVATYDYLDEAGDLLYQVVRRADPKGFSQRRPGPVPGTFLWTLGDVRRILYRLPELTAADPDEPVWILEGEKDVDRLWEAGLVATCNPMGAKKWRPEFGASLAGRAVGIIPDHDHDGREHGRLVSEALAGVAREVRTLDLADLCRSLGLGELAEKGDASDFLQMGGTADDLRRAFQATPPAAPIKIDNINLDPEPPVTIPIRGRGLDDVPINLTDTGNSLRLVRDHGDKLRYCVEWGKWLRWDGKRWKEDRTGSVYRLARRTIQRIGAEAAASADHDERRALLKWAITSEARKHVDAMIHLARFVEGIPVETAQLDRDPWALNVRNGTIDLRTGELRPHRREDLITRLADVDHDPAAICPRWDAFEREIMDGDEAMVGYLRRIAGYSITGDVREHQLFFFHGEGRNGKSMWLGIMHRLLNDYATTINSSLITVKQHDDHPTGLTDLEGRRFVSTIEVADGKRMAEALVKQLTGGDPIKARRMRQDYYSFMPTHKIILAANHKPDIRETTEAIWERVRLIPFPVTFVEPERVDASAKLLLKDKAIDEKLWAEAPGILATLVRACLEWQRDGLKEPEAVVKATAGYRAEMDRVTDFIAERCLVSVGVRVKTNALYDDYKTWAKASGEPEISKRKFGSNMERRGFTNVSSNKTWWRLGIALQGEDLEHFE